MKVFSSKSETNSEKVTNYTKIIPFDLTTTSCGNNSIWKPIQNFSIGYTVYLYKNNPSLKKHIGHYHQSHPRDRRQILHPVRRNWDLLLESSTGRTQGIPRYVSVNYSRYQLFFLNRSRVYKTLNS